ncbi:MAG: hypothetical protein PVH68_11030 [Armatimonadota bacterium]|jgi:hypothetical protein
MAPATIADVGDQLRSGIATTLQRISRLQELLEGFSQVLRRGMGTELSIEGDDDDVERDIAESLESAESMLVDAEASLEEASSFIEAAITAFEDASEDDEE